MDISPNTLTTPEELAALSSLAFQVRAPQCIVELGVFRGGSLKVLCDSSSSDVPVYGVDLFGREGTPESYQKKSTWTRWWEKFSGTKMSWKDNERIARSVAPRANIITADTAETGLGWIHPIVGLVGPPVALLYIDGDHSYEGVKRDWISWYANLAPHAHVVFDDYHRAKYPGISKLVDEEINGRLGFPVRQVGKLAIVSLP